MVLAAPLKHRHNHHQQQLQAPPSPTGSSSMREIHSGSSLEQVSSNKPSRSSTSSRKKSSTASDAVPTYCVVVIIMTSLALAVGLGFTLFSRYRLALETRLYERWHQAELTPLQQLLQSKMEALTKERNDLERDLKTKSALAEKLQSDLSNVRQHVMAQESHEQVAEKLTKENERLHKYRTKMHDAIQLLSSRLLLDHFGPGPHRVNVTIAFDPESNVVASGAKQYDSFVIEMAPEHLMPHTVYWFLSQVDQGLWNGCSFHRNAGHVVQSGPVRNFLTKQDEGIKLEKRFQTANLYSVLFQEYSAEFPHVKYTMGYAGRPGGPDFYVSTADNSDNHGPGGQSSYEDPTEADPCFAKVVEGIDVVDRMHKSAVQPGGYKHMTHNVAIVKMERIVKQ